MISIAIMEDFYKARDVRIYRVFAPSLRSERSGLKKIIEFS